MGLFHSRQLNLDRLLLHTRRLCTTVRVALDRGTSDGSLVRGLADSGVWAPFSVGSPDKPGGFGRGNSRGHLAAEQRGCPSPPLSRAISPPFAAVYQWYASAHGDCQRTRFADEVEASALAKPMFAYRNNFASTDAQRQASRLETAVGAVAPPRVLAASAARRGTPAQSAGRGSRVAAVVLLVVDRVFEFGYDGFQDVERRCPALDDVAGFRLQETPFRSGLVGCHRGKKSGQPPEVGCDSSVRLLLCVEPVQRGSDAGPPGGPGRQVRGHADVEGVQAAGDSGQPFGQGQAKLLRWPRVPR